MAKGGGAVLGWGRGRRGQVQGLRSSWHALTLTHLCALWGPEIARRTSSGGGAVAVAAGSLLCRALRATSCLR